MEYEINKEKIGLAARFGIDTSKYTSGDVAAQLIEQFEACTSFFSIIHKHIFFSILFFLFTAIGIGLVLDSYAFPAIFFLLSLIICIPGLGAIGFKKALSKVADGVDGILKHVINVTKDIYEVIKESKNSEIPNAIEIIDLAIIACAIIPIIKLRVQRGFFGRFVIKLVEKSVGKMKEPVLEVIKKATQKSVPTENKDNIEVCQENIDENYRKVIVEEIIKNLDTISQKTLNISKTIIKGILFISTLVSIISIILGLLLILILIIVRVFAKF